jgi:hypothetical protein
VQLLGRLNLLPTQNKTEKHKQRIIIFHWHCGWGRMMKQPWRMGEGQGAELSASRGETRKKHWEWGWDDKSNSQSRGVANRWASLVRLRVYSKLNYPTLLGEEMTSQICSGRANTAAPGRYNNRLDHLVQTGKVSYLRSQLHPALWTEGKNNVQKTGVCWDYLRVPTCNRCPIRPRKSGGEPLSCLSPPKIAQHEG